MAITLGKDGGGTSPPFGTDIISATFTEEVEVIDITNRSNMGGSAGAPGYRKVDNGFISRTWEIECHDPAGLIIELQANDGSGFTVMSVTENISIEGAVTYTVTAREQ